MANFDISHPEIMKSFFVEAVNKVEEFHIWYPMDIDTQHKFANEFAAFSGIEFPNCAGCVDVLLSGLRSYQRRRQKEQE